MKKSAMIFSAALAILGLTTYGFLGQGDQDRDRECATELKTAGSNEKADEERNEMVDSKFYYDVDSRFIATVTKADLHKATTLSDFLPENQKKPLFSYHDVKITILDDFRETDQSETGVNDLLTKAQLDLLRSTDYSTNILVKASYTVAKVDRFITPHMTIVPEKEAEYLPGKEQLIEYLRENSKASTGIVQDHLLRSGKLYFTISDNGLISDVKLASSCGYPSIDMKMAQLIKSVPGRWEPAENNNGQKVEQRLVYSFGLIGC